MDQDPIAMNDFLAGGSSTNKRFIITDIANPSSSTARHDIVIMKYNGDNTYTYWDPKDNRTHYDLDAGTLTNNEAHCVAITGVEPPPPTPPTQPNPPQ